MRSNQQINHFYLIVIRILNIVNSLKKNNGQLQNLTETQKNTIRELEKANEKSPKCMENIK